MAGHGKEKLLARGKSASNLQEMKQEKNTADYTVLAPFYDYLLQHVDYHSWYLFLARVMIRHIDNPRVVLELGCGTGRFGAKFSNEDFQIYGIDRSLDMLRVARTRAYRNFRVICADITRFNLSHSVDFIFSVHDTVNYLTSRDQLLGLFRSVRRVMHRDSIFLFDTTTEHNILKNFADKYNEYETRGTHVKWENTYDKGNRMIHSYLTFTGPRGEMVREHHKQRLHRREEILKLLDETGLELIETLSDYDDIPPHPESVMINYVTRKRR